MNTTQIFQLLIGAALAFLAIPVLIRFVRMFAIDVEHE